jgi:predicted dehydrogenase
MNIRDKKLTRRDFVKASSITAGGLLLGSLPIGRSAFAAGNDRIKIALIGCGNRGTGAAANALDAGDDIQLVAMADIYEERLNGSFEILSRRYNSSEKLNVPEENKFIGFDAYKKAMDVADVVLLTTPTFWRPQHYEEAVRRGKHIFMEKPVAVDARGVRRVLDAARTAKEKQLNVVVGLQRRYQNKYRELYKRIQDGQIGEITSGTIYWMEGEFGDLRQDPEWSELKMQIVNQFQFLWASGGQVLDQLIHNIDVANWFIGAHPVAAQGMGGRFESLTGQNKGQFYDHGFIEYTYPNDVVVAAQARRQANTYSRVAEEFMGTLGTSQAHGFGSDAILKDHRGNIQYSHDGTGDPSPYVQEHVELFNAIRNGNVIDNTVRAAHTTMTAIMGYMATYSGQNLTWEEALNSDVTFYPQHSLTPENVGYDTEAPVKRGENGLYPVPVPGVTKVI